MKVDYTTIKGQLDAATEICSHIRELISSKEDRDGFDYHIGELTARLQKVLAVIVREANELPKYIIGGKLKKVQRHISHLCNGATYGATRAELLIAVHGTEKELKAFLNVIVERIKTV
jgi:hypothetical protein